MYIGETNRNLVSWYTICNASYPLDIDIPSTTQKYPKAPSWPGSLPKALWSVFRIIQPTIYPRSPRPCSDTNLSRPGSPHLGRMEVTFQIHIRKWEITYKPYMVHKIMLIKIIIIIQHNLKNTIWSTVSL